MPVTVNINGLSCVHQGSLGLATATLPDVCKTPPYATPLPYPNVAMSSDLVGGTATVSVDGCPAAIQSSRFVRSTGDEAGSLGGVVSAVFGMEATFLSFSPTVLLEGQPACRLTDKMLMNAGNTACLAGEMQGVVPPLLSEGPGGVEPLDCEEPRFCAVYSMAVSCGHAARGFYHDLASQNLRALQVVAPQDEPDKLVVAWDSDCGFGTADCASVWVRQTPNGDWQRVDPATHEIEVEPPYLSYEVIHWGQVFEWMFNPMQIMRRTYRVQAVICHGQAHAQTPVGLGTDIEVYPEAELNAKAFLKYAHPELDGTSGSLRYEPEATWTFGGEIEGKLGTLEKKYEPSTDPEAATALPLFGTLLRHLGKMTLVFESMQKYGLDFKGELLPPSWELAAGIKVAEIPGKATVGPEGSFKFGFSPLIGLKFSVSLLDYLIRFAGTLASAAGGPLLAQALIQLKKKFATDPKNPNRTSLDIDIVLSTTGKIEGGFGLIFKQGQEAEVDSALLKGSIGVELQGLVKGSGKIWKFHAAAGGEVGARAAESKEPSALIASVKPVRDSKGRFTLEGGIAFNGLAVYYLLYAEVGAAGAENANKGRKKGFDESDVSAPQKAEEEAPPKAANLYRVLEKKGDCVLIDPWKWSPAAKGA